MSYIKNALLIGLVALSVLNANAEDIKLKKLENFKLEKSDYLFPATDFQVYERPKLEVRSTLPEDSDVIDLRIHRRQPLVERRNQFNSTEIAKKFMADNYPNIEYVFTDIFDDDNDEDYYDLAVIRMAQAINQVEVLNTAININIDKLTGSIISSGVSVWEDLKPEVSSHLLDEDEDDKMDVKAAIELINDQLELLPELDLSELKIDNFHDGRVKVHGVPYSHDGTLIAKKSYTGISQTEAEEIWDIIVQIDIDLYDITVGINKKEIISVNDLSNHATYRVVPLNKPNVGNSARTVYTDPYLKKYSPKGWHNNNSQSYTSTMGNNIILVENSDGTTDVEDSQPIDGGKDMKFEFTYSLANKKVEQNQKAAAANAFYVTNMLHDNFYKLGFNEASGNFQYHNFGSSGKDRDPVIVIVQDRSGKNNSQFNLSVDGEPPQMRLFPFIYSDTEVDPAFDNEIMIHEYTHGVSQRLTGGPNTVLCLQNTEGLALNEGWSDFFAHAFQWNTNRDRYYAHHIFGMLKTDTRKYPITSNKNLNPLMYSSLSYSGSSFDTYKGGELWAVILHEVFYNIVERYKKDEDYFLEEKSLDFSPSNYLVMKIVVDGMRMQPCSPTFITARDAILTSTERIIGDNTKFKCLVWVGFARRGLGYGAKAGSNKVYKNSTTVPSECKSYVNF